MQAFNFENLNVYQRSLKLAIEVIEKTKKFDFKYNRIRDQFIGAIISVPLNLAEGSGRKSIKDKTNFCKIAQSSAFECIPLTSICHQIGLIDQATFNNWRVEIQEICKMISGLIRHHQS